MIFNRAEPWVREFTFVAVLKSSKKSIMANLYGVRNGNKSILKMHVAFQQIALSHGQALLLSKHLKQIYLIHKESMNRTCSKTNLEEKQFPLVAPKKNLLPTEFKLKSQTDHERDTTFRRQIFHYHHQIGKSQNMTLKIFVRTSNLERSNS